MGYLRQMVGVDEYQASQLHKFTKHILLIREGYLAHQGFHAHILDLYLHAEKSSQHFVHHPHHSQPKPHDFSRKRGWQEPIPRNALGACTHLYSYSNGPRDTFSRQRVPRLRPLASTTTNMSG